MSCFSAVFLIYGLLALGFARLAYADYDINNANNTVGYAAAGTDWRTFSFSTQNLTLETSNGNVLVDSSKCYDGDYAREYCAPVEGVQASNNNLVGACSTENNCQISIPFTGSGITVYVLQAGFQGVNASITIDGGQTVTATLQPPTPPAYQTPNVSLFNLQSLPSSDHTATINLLGYGDGTTSLYFDWAHINESLVDPLTSTAPSTSSVAQSSSLTSSVTSTSGVATVSSSSTTQPVSISSSLSPTTTSSFNSTPGTTSTSASFITAPSKSLNLGAVVGGACGGLAAVVAIIAAVVLLKKRQSRHARLQESRTPDPFLASAMISYSGSVLSPSPAHLPLDEKARQRLAARDAMVYYPRGLADSESSDFYIHSDSGGARRPIVDPGQWTTDSSSHDDPVHIDTRREDGSVIDIHSSGAQNTITPLTVAVNSVPPPVYQSLEPRAF